MVSWVVTTPFVTCPTVATIIILAPDLAPKVAFCLAFALMFLPAMP